MSGHKTTETAATKAAPKADLGSWLDAIGEFVEAAKNQATDAVKRGTDAVRRILDQIDSEVEGLAQAPSPAAVKAAQECLDQCRAIASSGPVPRTAGAAPEAINPNVILIVNLVIAFIQAWLKQHTGQV